MEEIAKGIAFFALQVAFCFLVSPCFRVFFPQDEKENRP
jgi:hypothetical protein